MGKLVVVTGGQYGSEAKGAVAAHLARRSGNPNLIGVRVAGPNAGHTVYSDQGQRFALRCIPVAAVAKPGAKVVLAAGSEVDREVLELEKQWLQEAGLPLNLEIDSQATVLGEEHHLSEQALGMQNRLGSTSKGIGAARSARIMREADLWGGELDTARHLRRELARGAEVHIEGTQGYGLGLHAGHYPFCTSSDCRAIDFMAMAGISPWDAAVTELEVWITFRTYPIRVAGNSGPMHEELTWEQMNREVGIFIEPEKTTVTQKVRRIGRWDPELAREAIEANGGAKGVKLALMFVDYIDHRVAGATNWSELTPQAKAWIEQKERELGARFSLLGTGPTSIIDRRSPAQIEGQESLL
jgi:adenylosuccinate synthase